jgi:hypothetical protein
MTDLLKNDSFCIFWVNSFNGVHLLHELTIFVFYSLGWTKSPASSLFKSMLFNTNLASNLDICRFLQVIRKCGLVNISVFRVIAED